MSSSLLNTLSRGIFLLSTIIYILVDILAKLAYNVETMRTVKLNNRYNAHRKYGYRYSLEIESFEWKKYFDLKKVAVNMFGESADVNRRMMWRDERVLLGTAPWAYHYKNIRKTTHIYFRKEQDLEQVVMLWALTANEINN